MLFLFVYKAMTVNHPPKANSHCSFPSDLSGTTSRSSIGKQMGATALTSRHNRSHRGALFFCLSQITSPDHNRQLLILIPGPAFLQLLDLSKACPSNSCHVTWMWKRHHRQEPERSDIHNDRSQYLQRKPASQPGGDCSTYQQNSKSNRPDQLSGEQMLFVFSEIIGKKNNKTTPSKYQSR